MSTQNEPDDALNWIRQSREVEDAIRAEVNDHRSFQERVREQMNREIGIPADRQGEIQNLANLQTGITEEVRQQYASLTEERLREEIGDYFTQRLNPSGNFEREETDEEYMRRIDAQEDAARIAEQNMSMEEEDEEIDLTDEQAEQNINGLLDEDRPEEAEVEQHYNGVVDQIERQGHTYIPLTTELVDQYLGEMRQDRPGVEGVPFTAAMGRPIITGTAGELDNTNLNELTRAFTDPLREYTEEEQRRMYQTFVDPIRHHTFPVEHGSNSQTQFADNRQYPLTPDQVISKPDFPVTKPVPVKFSRFKDAEWFGGKEDVLVGGAGGIGSWLSLLLTRAGFQVTVYDYDKIEEHNLSGQLFSTKQIGQEKTFALSNIINDLCGSPINNITEKYDKDSMINPYMFSCFDNMEARKIMFDKWSQNFGGSANAIFIDGRLLFEQLTIFCIKGQDAIAMDTYKNVDLFSDADVATENCTLKQTTHTAAMIAAHMVGFFTNFLKSIKTDMDATNVPYRWEYFVPFGIVE